MPGTAAPSDSERLYDSLAARYDQEVGGTTGAALAKARSTYALKQLFRSGDLVADIGCGTGADACNLASRGVEVVGIDVSTQMLEATRRRADHRGVANLVHTAHLPASRMAELTGLFPGRSFAGAYSLFGVLNLEQDLGAVRRGAARLLPEGAPFLVGLVNPFVLWELTLYPMLLRFDKSMRKVRRLTTMRISNVRAQRVPVQLLTPEEFAGQMAPDFRLERTEGTNILVPPPHLDVYARAVPKFVSWMSRIERGLSLRPPWNRLGYFSLLTFRRAGL
jgi:ubiquinone/menaquinone biosynthesis C-methylase UbiE